MSDPRPRKKSMILTALLGLAALGLAVVTAAGRLGRFWWIADLFSHFAVYCTVASAAMFVLTVLLKRYKIAAALLLVLGINGWMIFPEFNPFSETKQAKGPVLHLAQMNILHKNRDREDALAFIRQSNADIIFIQEIDPWWSNVITDSDVPYHFVALSPSEGSFGIAMLVRDTLDSNHIQLDAARVIDFFDDYNGTERPVIEASLRLAEQHVQILSIHPPPPLSAAHSHVRDVILQQAKDWSDAQTDPHIIIGDFNTTPWSHAFAILTQDGQLANSLSGRGNQGSWPTSIPIPLKLPIDHCLFSHEWVCTQRLIGGYTGSDHRPLLVTLALLNDVTSN